jgi:glycosyltransferase involved in cell wall biosynthesis
VIIGTYGDEDYWGRLAQRAAASVTDDMECIHVHGNTLAQARNEGARRASGERLVFLDADDELTDDFSRRVVEPEDVLQPRTMFREGATITPSHWIRPLSWEDNDIYKSLLIGNHIIVGAPVKRDAFLSVGGFDEWTIAEDWALWLKMAKAGYSFGKTSAIYIVHVNLNSRNHQPDNGEIDRIRRMYS